MTDEALRDLERAWRASGTTEDEVRYLRARRRAGELDPRQLELARRLGSPVARKVLDAPEPCPAPPHDDREALTHWLAGLADWGAESVVRVLIAAARTRLPHRWSRGSHPDDKLQRAIEEVEAWVRSPDVTRLARLAQVEAETEEGAGWWWGGQAQVHAACVVARQPSEAMHYLGQLGERGDAILEPVREELIPWALGHADPIAERLRAGGERVGNEENIIRGVDVSDDGAWALSVAKGNATVWGLAEHTAPRRLVHPRRGGLSQEVFAGVFLDPGGERVATGDDSGVVRVWDVETGAVAWEHAAHEGRVDTLCALADGRLVSGGYDGRAHVWEIGEVSPQRSVEHGRGVTALAASSEADRLVSSDADGVVFVSALGGDPAADARRLEHSPEVSGASLLPKQLLLTSGGDRLRLWGIDGALQREIETPAHNYALACSRDGRWAAVAAADSAIRMYDLGGAPHEPPRARWWTLGLQFALAFSPDGRWLFAGGRNGAVRRYDLEALPQ